MRRDHRPYAVKRFGLWLERWYTRHFLAPQFAALGPHPFFMQPWHISVYGPDIRLGAQVHILAARDRPVAFTVWEMQDHKGSIEIGDHCLLSPGVRLDSACSIQIGANSMVASNVYITDADWHDLYDRAKPIGTTRPVVLAENVWIGFGSIVCKGARIGANSIIGAGSVVTGEIPANVIAAGNPAKVLRALDPDQPLRTRADFLADPERMAMQFKALDRYVLGNNGYLNWLRTLLAPRADD